MAAQYGRKRPRVSESTDASSVFSTAGGSPSVPAASGRTSTVADAIAAGLAAEQSKRAHLVALPAETARNSVQALLPWLARGGSTAFTPPSRTGRRPLGVSPLDDAPAAARIDLEFNASGAAAADTRPGRLVQARLSLGQREARRCATCGMMYTPSLPEDVAAHTRFCSTFKGATYISIPVASWESVLTFGAVACDGTDACSHENAQIVLLDSHGMRAHSAKVREIRDLLSEELGPESHPVSNTAFTSEYVARATPAADAAPEVQYWLYVTRKRMLGVLVTQRLTDADNIRNVWLSLAGTVLEEQPESCPEVTPRSCCLGISQIWVHAAHRRSRIAVCLVSAARAHAVYGYPIPVSRVAWCAPTAQGRAFAAAYVCRRCEDAVQDDAVSISVYDNIERAH